MEKFSPIGVNVASDWYRTYNNDKEMVDRIKLWINHITKDERFLTSLYRGWREYTEEEKAGLKHRTILLMKIVVLRAHGYVAADFKQFDNPFKGRYQVKFTSY